MRQLSYGVPTARTLRSNDLFLRPPPWQSEYASPDSERPLFPAPPAVRQEQKALPPVLVLSKTICGAPWVGLIAHTPGLGATATAQDRRAESGDVSRKRENRRFRESFGDNPIETTVRIATDPKDQP